MATEKKTVQNTDIGASRQYVIVCNEHSGMWAGCVLFWGQLTDDGDKRSFGGYTTDIDSCERYSPQDLESGNWHFAVFNKDRMTLDDFLACRDIAIRPDELALLGYKPMRVWYRP